jgi:hypothetical protein
MIRIDGYFLYVRLRFTSWLLACRYGDRALHVTDDRLVEEVGWVAGVDCGESGCEAGKWRRVRSCDRALVMGLPGYPRTRRNKAGGHKTSPVLLTTQATFSLALCSLSLTWDVSTNIHVGCERTRGVGALQMLTVLVRPVFLA